MTNYVCILNILCWSVFPVQSAIYKLGLVIYDYDQGPISMAYQLNAAAITIALDHAKQEGILTNQDIRVYPKLTGSPTTSAGYAVDLKVTEDVDVIFGHTSSRSNIPVAYLTAYWNMPHLSWSSLNPTLSDKRTFKTFVRSQGGYDQLGTAIVELLYTFNWKKIGVFVYNYALCQYALEGLVQQLGLTDVEIKSYITFTNENMSDQEIYENLQQLKRNVRIIVVCVPDVRKVMLKAESMGMCNGEFVFIDPYALPSTDPYKEWYRNDTDDARALLAFKHLLHINMLIWKDEPSKTKVLQFFDDIPLRMREPPWNDSYAFDNGLKGQALSLYAYDAAKLYFLWLNHSIDNSLDHRNGKLFWNFVINASFEGLSDTVKFSVNGDRQNSYIIEDFKDGTGLPRMIGYAETFKSKTNVVTIIADPLWQTKDGLPPPDVPVCGFDGARCLIDSDNTFIIVGIFVAALILLVGGLACAYIIRKKQMEDELMKMLWKVTYDDLYYIKGLRGLGSQLGRSALSILGHSRQSIGSTQTVTQLFAKVARYKEYVVAVKKINRRSLALTRKDHLELKEMREMSHENVNEFIGACPDPPNVCVLYQYCQKGSIQDILENEDIKLDWMFKLSIITDIINGMEYIHNSALKSHGKLKSSNCVVDSRWVCKITDYGLWSWYEGDMINVDDIGEQEIYKGMLWTAPELLRRGALPRDGTPEGDIYSFGIILHEIYYRMGVFPVPKYSTKEIVDLVRKCESIPFRPTVMESDTRVSKPMEELMDMCWQEDSKKRMPFKQIKAYVKKNNPVIKGSIMDNMLKMLEKYANNLEDLVETRTQELMEEKEKTNQLLYKLIPKSVAEKLKLGERVYPEAFDAVTIFFSDIVGFTTIAAKCNPMEVVDLLNGLYTLFDDIIDKFDVYKVETIGDAYMVVSGLPNRNGDQHAGEIATMALTILSKLQHFRIKNLPDEKLMVRIGLHSGPVCAGIVGLTMPRYCLFGDTVNTASRMESHGKAQRIHISSQCKVALIKLAGYYLRERGEISIKVHTTVKKRAEWHDKSFKTKCFSLISRRLSQQKGNCMKVYTTTKQEWSGIILFWKRAKVIHLYRTGQGKGIMFTHWLCGKEGFDLPLPYESSLSSSDV